MLNIEFSDHTTIANVMARFREELSFLGGDKNFQEVERDPSEFLRFFEQYFHFSPIKTVNPRQTAPSNTTSSVTTNIICKHDIFHVDFNSNV